MSLAIAKPLRRWTFARALRSSTHSTRAARINITFAKCFFTSDQWSSIQPHFIFIFFDFRPMSNNTLRNARIVFHINFFSFHYFAVFGTTSYKSAMKFYLLWAIIISHICIDISYRKHNNNKAKTRKKNIAWTVFDSTKKLNLEKKRDKEIERFSSCIFSQLIDMPFVRIDCLSYGIMLHVWICGYEYGAVKLSRPYYFEAYRR